MNISDSQIRAMFPNAGIRLEPHLAYIGSALTAAKIDNPHRIAAFLAQLAHESAEYRYMEEIASGEDYDILVNSALALELGNTEPGDGTKYKGLGPIQITGKNNQRAACAALGIPFADHKKLATPQYGTASACWYWNSRQLSPIADHDWFRLITRIINGGYNGLADRVAYWNRNRTILGLPPVDLDNEMGSIMEFQSAQGLTADGAVGPMTMRALESERKAA